MSGKARFSAAAEAGERYSGIFSKITNEESLAALQTKQINATRAIQGATARLHSFNERSEAALCAFGPDFEECMGILMSIQNALAEISVRTTTLVERLEARRHLHVLPQLVEDTLCRR